MTASVEPIGRIADLPGEVIADVRSGVLPAPLRPRAQLHILDVTTYFGPTTGGIRTYLLEKARYVERHPAYRQTMVVPGRRDEVADGDGVRCYRLRSPVIPFQDQYRALLGMRALRHIIAHERPDVIEVGSPLVVPWIVAWANRGTGTPVCWYFHGNLVRLAGPGSLEDPPRHRWRAAAVRRYVAAVARRADRVLAASETAVAELESAGVRHVSRTALGVDLERFAPTRRVSAADLRRRMRWPDGPVVLYAGRLAREKCLDVALRAWSDPDTAPAATLVLMGDGPDRARLERLAAGLETIRFEPHVADRDLIADAMAATDVYLAPGPAETFGLSATEALACAVPVVSVAAGGVAELVRRSGAGCLYPVGDAAGLATAIRTVLSSDRSATGLAGRHYVAREHGWDHVLSRQFEIYRDMAR